MVRMSPRFSLRLLTPRFYYRHIVVKRTDTGESFEEDVDVLISARGNLNEAKWPKIPGIELFKGKRMHSASWDHEYVSGTSTSNRVLTEIFPGMTSRTRKSGSSAVAQVPFKLSLSSKRSKAPSSAVLFGARFGSRIASEITSWGRWAVMY